MTPILPYNSVGGKASIYKWIISHFPKHKTYVEPFCGSAVILLNKQRTDIEIINDRNNKIVNMFKMIREQPKELIKLLENTPFSREEEMRAIELYNSKEKWEQLTPIEQARTFIVAHNMGAASLLRTNRKTAFKRKYTRKEHIYRYYLRLTQLKKISKRLQQVVIENRDAIELIKDYKNEKEALFYIDPPYLGDIRTSNIYDLEMESAFQHKQLIDLLLVVKGKVCLSHYPCKLYDSLLSNGWTREQKQITNRLNRKRTEAIYMNYKKHKGFFDD